MIDFQNYLYDKIPISHAMGVKVELLSKEEVILSAEYAKNLNHKCTVFGGSLHSLATLSCWSLLHHQFEASGTEIVIAQSHIDYLRPVCSDFQARVTRPEEKIWKRFLEVLKEKGKAKIELQAEIFQGEKLAVTFQGTFAALSTQR